MTLYLNQIDHCGLNSGDKKVFCPKTGRHRNGVPFDKETGYALGQTKPVGHKRVYTLYIIQYAVACQRRESEVRKDGAET